MVQRPATKRGRTSSAADRQGGATLKQALRYVPLASKVLLAVLLAVAFFIGYRAVASASFFKVGNVDVEGTTRVSREDVRATVLRSAGAQGVWKADLDAVSRQLRELPWVRAAVVSRVLPSGLRVRITEREPRLIARTAQGRLVWVDEEGVMLGAASAGERDVIIRGLDEGSGDSARQQNRDRLSVAMELKADWEKTGLGRRISEVNLGDVRDVRVQLAGADAQTEVRLGQEDYIERLHVAVRKLDERRQAYGDCVSYIDMTVSKSKRAILAPVPCAQLPAESVADAAPAEAQPVADTRRQAEVAAVAPAAAKKGGAIVRKAAEKKVAVKEAAVKKKEDDARKKVQQAEKQRAEKERAKRDAPAKGTGAATRPRRVG